MFLAHIGRRWSGVSWAEGGLASIVVRLFIFSKIFSFSKTPWPVIAKFCDELSWVGGTKVCSLHLSHMTKMATHIWLKHMKIVNGTGGPISVKFSTLHQGFQFIIVCSNDEPGLTLTYFMAMSNLVIKAFISYASENSGFFRNYCSLLACDLKVVRVEFSEIIVAY